MLFSTGGRDRSPEDFRAAPGDKAPAPTAAKAGGKTLVVYYSASGRTKTATGGDLFELVPQQPYTTADLDYNNRDSRVSREHEDVSQRHVALVKDTPDKFASYETIFVGYPIWWGGAAWIVDDFVKRNDFTGKTVIPFATSYSSPMGSSGHDLAAMAGTGNWQEGACFDRDMTRDAVMTRAKGLK